MRLSIIVPVYNAEAYLRQCVDSLLQQTVKDYEIILVNDGSPDNSLQIMEEYASRYPKTVKILSSENGGQGRARNLGIEMSCGETLGFVDSDDWIAPDMYEKLLATMEQEQADVVVCDFERVFSDGHRERVKTWREDQPMAVTGSACDKLFRRSAVGEIRFPEGLWYEDFGFTAKVLLRTEKLSYVPEALYFYRTGQTSTMKNENARKNLDMLEVLSDIRETMEDSRKEDFDFLVLNHLLLDSINRVERQHSPDKAEVLWLMRAYVQEQIPSLRASASFRQESRNRRIVMWLNYHGMQYFARKLIDWNRH